MIFFFWRGGGGGGGGGGGINIMGGGELKVLCNLIKLFFFLLLSSLGYSSLPCRVLNFQITIQSTREIFLGLAWNGASASYS